MHLVELVTKRLNVPGATSSTLDIDPEPTVGDDDDDLSDEDDDYEGDFYPQNNAVVVL